MNATEGNLEHFNSGVSALGSWIMKPRFRLRYKLTPLEDENILVPHCVSQTNNTASKTAME